MMLGRYKILITGFYFRQIVDGVIYRMTLDLGETTCPKGSDNSDCQLKDPTGSVSIITKVY